jgi:Flp pilus assembly protein TadD
MRVNQGWQRRQNDVFSGGPGLGCWPTIAAYHAELACAYAQSEDFASARKSLQAALKCHLMKDEAAWAENLEANSNELATWSYNARGFTALMQTNFGEAIHCYQKVGELKP